MRKFYSAALVLLVSFNALPKTVFAGNETDIKVSTAAREKDEFEKTDVPPQTGPEEAPDQSEGELSREKLQTIEELAKRWCLPFEEVLERLRVGNDCYLIPLTDIDEHRECLLNLFSRANEDYMRYYLDGRLRSQEDVERIYFTNAMERLWSGDLPRSLQFIIDCNNTSIGRIAVGPLYDRGETDAETGYAILEDYSGQGIMSRAVSSLLRLLHYLMGNGIYKLDRLRVVTKESNIASNKILEKNRIQKSLHKVGEGSAQRNEYFYYFEKQNQRDGDYVHLFFCF